MSLLVAMSKIIEKMEASEFFSCNVKDYRENGGQLPFQRLWKTRGH